MWYQGVMSASSLSLEKLEKICAKNPTSILFARLAEGFLQQGNVKRATEICRQGLRYRPSYVAGHVVMGKCHLAVGHFEEARQEFQKVLQLDADHPAALWHLGQIDLKLGWDELALGHFEMALVLDPLNQKIADQIAQLKSVPVVSDDVTDHTEQDDNSEPEQKVPEVIEDEIPDHEQEHTLPVDDFEDEDVEDLHVTDMQLEVLETENSDEEIVAGEVLEADFSEDESGADEDLSALVSELEHVDETQNDDVAEQVEEEPVSCDSGPIATATLAELYAQQGLVEQAVATLEQVLARNPNNAQVQARLDELRS